MPYNTCIQSMALELTPFALPTNRWSVPLRIIFNAYLSILRTLVRFKEFVRMWQIYEIWSCHTIQYCGPGSVFGIATGYELDGPGIESRWGGEIFRTCPDRPWGPPSFVYNGYRVFPGGKELPGRDADLSPLLVPWSWKGRAIPLLPLWAVRPVQSLSACAMVHFTYYSVLIYGLLTLASSI